MLRHLQTFVVLLTLGAGLQAQTMKAPDITKVPTLYVVPYAHLDTQWRWEFPQSISEYLLKTMRVNFYLMDKYPHYVFNWTGANRYRLMKEYFPSDYAKIKGYVDKGQWFPAGSSMEEGDVNLPSAEAIIRQVLYGNDYFRKEFGKASAEFMLPDCFGFPADLPSILAHAGVKGFSTQKLSAAWQPAPRVGGPDSPEQTPEGIPFNVGVWEGPDGKSIIAALNPEGYGSTIRTDLSKEPAAEAGRGGRGEQDWVKRIELDGKVTGVYADYHYIGTGDIGGSVDEESVKLLEAMVTHGKASLPPAGFGRGGRGGRGGQAEPAPPPGPEVEMGDGPVHVISSAADQMFLDIKPEMTSRMPRYKGDLELINHSAGSLTSEAYHKRWNRKNEILADAAEKASVAAHWLGGRPYPQQRLNDAWTLVLGGHFHDTGAGTATPQAYVYAQNDDVIAMNQFAGVLTSATEGVAEGMNTETTGIPVVVYNSLNIPREDVVEAAVSLPAGTKAIRVTGPDGKEVPAQWEDGKAVFVAKAPSVGYAVYGVEAASEPATSSTLKVTAPTGGRGFGGFGGGGRGGRGGGIERSLENARYKVTLDNQGDVSSIHDKLLDKELLSGPIRLDISSDHPTQWPAWNMDFDQEQAAPRAYVRGGQVRIKENGPARVTLEITRETEGSKFTQTVSLSAGDAGNRVEFGADVDWATLYANLKAAFPLSASNTDATYNWGMGTVERPNASERQFEVASHQWIDLTDKSGAYGTTILTDVKNGSDKPNDNTIRLTLVRSPGADTSYTDQSNQDWGHHEIVFGLAGHQGDWRQGQTDWQGYRLNEPLTAFETTKHSGTLGKEFSLMKIDNPRIRVMALKKAELSDEVILRMVEMSGRPEANVHVSFAGPITSAREVNGQEMPVGPATVSRGVLDTSFSAYQPRTFALRLGAAPARVPAVQSQPVTLTYDLAVASNDDRPTTGGFDGRGDAMPAEMLPAELTFNGVRFKLAEAGSGKQNAEVAKGQTINLPAGNYNRVYVLAAASDGDTRATFKVGDKFTDLNIEDWGGHIGQWDTRIWKNDPLTDKDWAVSANHAVWDPDPAKQRSQGHRDWSPRYPEDFVGIEPGYIKRADLAWYCSHHHTPEGLNQPYEYSYLFAYPIDLPAGARTLTLPNNDRIKVLAVSVAQEGPIVTPAHPLYDTLGADEPKVMAAMR
ncbi:MAG TPA: glycoside hydrolase family 38 C-terminal domain-containing protein [Bryobacteraceae bacterium]|nr:glycoside hydrolase family 38 C-terminal domain-containing protein [Bryobacteraceae bacterium]